MKGTRPSESRVKRLCRKWIEKTYRGKLVRWVAPASNGVQDCILFIPFAVPVFVEFKREGQHRSEPLQGYWADWLEVRGFKVWRDVESLAEFQALVENFAPIVDPDFERQFS